MQRIHSKSREEANTVLIDWNLGNGCNMDCRYCHSWFKSGTNSFPDIDRAKQFVSHVARRLKGSNRPVVFSFVGGEPTTYGGLPALIRFIKEETGFSVSLMSNGVAPVTYWGQICPDLDIINLTYHDSVDFINFSQVCDLLKKKRLNVAFAMMPDSFADALKKIERLRSLGINCYPQPLYRDHARRRLLYDYTEEQLGILFPNMVSDITIEEDGAITGVPSVNHLIHEGRNSFRGMRCGIGFDQIVIDQDGTIRGGWCRVGGSLGNIHAGNFEFPLEPVICTKDHCSNLNDLSVPKWQDGFER